MDRYDEFISASSLKQQIQKQVTNYRFAVRDSSLRIGMTVCFVLWGVGVGRFAAQLQHRFSNTDLSFRMK